MKNAAKYGVKITEPKKGRKFLIGFFLLNKLLSGLFVMAIIAFLVIHGFIIGADLLKGVIS